MCGLVGVLRRGRCRGRSGGVDELVERRGSRGRATGISGTTKVHAKTWTVRPMPGPRTDVEINTRTP